MMRKESNGRLAGMVLCLMAVGGCASGPPAGAGTMAGGMMAALEDDAIASVVMTANTAEIEEAQLAHTTTTTAAIHALATRIETDHRSSNERALATLGAIGSDSDPHPLRQSLVQNHQEAMQALTPQRGPGFDRAFVERQIAIHRYLLTTIDQTLMPSARTAAVRAQLTSDRAAVAAHLELAQSTLSSIGTR